MKHPVVMVPVYSFKVNSTVKFDFRFPLIFHTSHSSLVTKSTILKVSFSIKSESKIISSCVLSSLFRSYEMLLLANDTRKNVDIIFV